MVLSFRRSPLPKSLQHFPFNLVGYLLPEEALVPSEGQKRAWREAAQRTDVVADNLVKAFKASGMRGRQQFNQALEHGIETVSEPLPELAAFFHALETTPYWVDQRKIRIAQAAMSRVPPETLYPMMLSFGLPASYIASKVNQALVRAGGLELKAASRAVETTGWVAHCSKPGGLERHGEAFKAIAHVRLVHGFMRAGLSRGADWDYENWDVPINQAQQSLTLLPFIVGTYLTMPLGNLMSPREMSAVLHLWRYISHLMGIEPSLQITNFSDLLKMLWLTGWAEIEVDQLTSVLNKALQDAIAVIYGLPDSGPLAKPVHWLARQYHDNLSRLIMGKHYSDALGSPKLNLMAGTVLGLAAARLVVDLPLHFIPGANTLRVQRNVRKQKRFLEAASLRAKADMTFNRDNARMNAARIKESVVAA